MTPTISRATSAARVEFFLAAVAILCGALAIRLTNLYGMPVFIDEANHLNWAQRFSIGDATYPLLMDGKLLLGVTLAQFQVLGPAPLWLARAAVAVLSLLSCTACMAVGKSIYSGKAGLLAGILYSVLPLAVFFDRQVLADPLMADFGALAIVFTLWAAKMRRRWPAIRLALSLAAAVLAKLFGVLFLAFPVIGLFILPSQGKRGRLAGTYTSATGLAIILAAAFLAALRPMWGYDDSKLANQQVGFSTCPPAVCQLDVSKQFDVLLSSTNSLSDLIPPYVGWPIVALALCGWFIGRKTKQRERWTLALATIIMLAAFLLTTRDIPPRYVGFLSVPLAALAASGLLSTAQIIRARLRVTLALAAAVLLIPTGWSVANTVPILFNPERARLPSLDRQGYFTSVYGGTGIREAALAVLRRETDSTVPPVVVIDSDLSQIASYFDRTRVDVRASSEVHPADVGRWMIAGQRIYFLEELVDTSVAQTADNVPRRLLFEEIGRYPRMNGQREIRLRVVTGADQALRRDIFREFFIKPEKLADEYMALAASLPAPTEDAAVLLVYPPNQLDTLDALLDGQPRIVTRGIGDSWPLAAAETGNALAALTGGKQSVTIVFLEETHGDPDRFIETWLTSHLFRIGETWFGPLRLVEFAGGGESAQTITVGARFGDGIVLESVEVLDSAAKQGGVIRLRLNWRTLAPVAESFKVFVHVFSGDAIVAQHDGQPVGELRPTTTWQTGEPIADQFAIRIPGGAKPGAYQLRIGVYDLSTQARLSVTFADGASGEFFVGGEIVIK